MKTMIALSTTVALSLAANVTLARGWGHGSDMTDADREQMREEHIQNRVNRLLERFDIDQDGQITLAEVQTVRTEHFAEIDVDSDGFLTVEELEDFKAKMAEQRQNDDSQDQANNRPPKKQGCHGRGNRIERLDNDDDGLISLEEFTINVPLFDKFDADEDGVLTQEELSQAPDRGNRRGR